MSKDEKLIETLQSLAQYQIDAIFIIAQAMSCVAGQDIRNKLSEIEKEYEKNIKTISDMLVQQGEKAPEHTRDFKGFFMQGYTGMRGMMSDEGLMKALATNIGILANAFEEALKKGYFSGELQLKINDILVNIKKHLEYFTSMPH